MAIRTMDTRWPAPSNSSNDSPTRHRTKCSLTWVTGSMITPAPASFTSTDAAEATSPRNTWRRMKHRAAIEPTLGHLKDNKRLDRNRLKGVLGDKINVILSAAGMNFHKIMKALAQGKGFLRKILGWLLGIRINRPAAMRFQLS